MISRLYSPKLDCIPIMVDLIHMFRVDMVDIPNIYGYLCIMWICVYRIPTFSSILNKDIYTFWSPFGGA